MPSSIGYIWPKDPRPGNPRRWPKWWRLSDILKGKGPDIYVGRLRPRASPRATTHSHNHNLTKLTPKKPIEHGWKFETGWSLWEKDHLAICKHPHCERCARLRAKEEREDQFPWARRHPQERYDYRMREYRVPDEGTWAGRVHCDEAGHDVPLRYWDRYGRGYPAGYWHDMVYGAHGAAGAGFGFGNCVSE
ncbi:hypothetical protein BDV12DRAFT_198048 [Aspergillus spectabilis]